MIRFFFLRSHNLIAESDLAEFTIVQLCRNDQILVHFVAQAHFSLHRSPTSNVFQHSPTFTLTFSRVTAAAAAAMSIASMKEKEKEAKIMNDDDSQQQPRPRTTTVLNNGESTIVQFPTTI